MDFKVFEATPGVNIMVLPDAPVYTIVAVSNDFVDALNINREDVMGKGYFKFFYENPADAHFSGKQNMKTSFQYVLEHKRPHKIPLLRYHLLNNNGAFNQQYWHIKNAPVLHDNGEVQFIIHSAVDVTEQQVAEQKATPDKDFEKAYNFFMNAPVIIGFLKDDDYIIELANEGLLEVWDRTAEVIGKPLLEAIPELEAQGFITLLDNVRTSGESFYAYEYPITLRRHGKDEVLYFDFVYKPFYENGSDEKAAGVFSVGHDVTAQVLAKKLLEDAKRETEKQKRLYETINGSTPDHIYVFDLDYKFTYANKALLDMWGTTWGESIGKGLLEIGYEPWHAHMHEKEIDKVVATKQPVRGEVAFPHAALGNRIYDYIFVPVLNDKDEVEAVAGTSRDITDLKMAEQAIRESNERFRNLADNSPMFVFIIDPDPAAPVNYWNKTWLQYTGQALEEARGRAWDGIIHPDDMPVIMSHYTPAFEHKQTYFIPAVRVKRHDGVFRYHAFKGNPMYLTNGAFNGYVGVGFDIHDQKMAEDTLKQAEVQLQQLVEARTAELKRTVEELQRSNVNLEEFAYAASHDMKEPIRKIHFFSDRIKGRLADKMEAEDFRLFERMQQASKRMATLIDDLLAYSQATKGAAEEEEIDLNKKVQWVLEDLELEVQDKNGKVVVQPLPVIKGNRRQFQQLFQNLISNALKYTKPGLAPEVHIAAAIVKGEDVIAKHTAADPNKAYHLITIKDNGIGFEQKDAERIFNVFTRLHGNAEYRGTGVGLSIVRKVVENHNGYIWAQSEPGEGALFSILLPIHDNKEI